MEEQNASAHLLRLTDQQYRQLLILVYLGEWVANSAAAEDNDLPDVQEAAEHIFTLAPQFDAGDWVEYCDGCGAYHGNQNMETALMPYVNNYEEETFWDMLAYHLAYRDVMLTSAAAEQDLSPQMEMRLWRRKEQYDQEFSRHGLDHVRLVFHGGRK